MKMVDLWNISIPTGSSRAYNPINVHYTKLRTVPQNGTYFYFLICISWYKFFLIASRVEPKVAEFVSSFASQKPDICDPH